MDKIEDKESKVLYKGIVFPMFYWLLEKIWRLIVWRSKDIEDQEIQRYAQNGDAR